LDKAIQILVESQVILGDLMCRLEKAKVGEKTVLELHQARQVKPDGEIPVLDELEREILDALDGVAMTADRLCVSLSVSRSTLFGGKDKQGGLHGLRRKGLIKNDRKVGGYYRPDAPPRPESY